jgi:hypothetical protein
MKIKNTNCGWTLWAALLGILALSLTGCVVQPAGEVEVVGPPVPVVVGPPVFVGPPVVVVGGGRYYRR